MQDCAIIELWSHIARKDALRPNSSILIQMSHLSYSHLLTFSPYPSRPHLYMHPSKGLLNTAIVPGSTTASGSGFHIPIIDGKSHRGCRYTWCCEMCTSTFFEQWLGEEAVKCFETASRPEAFYQRLIRSALYSARVTNESCLFQKVRPSDFLIYEPIDPNCGYNCA